MLGGSTNLAHSGQGTLAYYWPGYGVRCLSLDVVAWTSYWHCGRHWDGLLRSYCLGGRVEHCHTRDLLSCQLASFFSHSRFCTISTHEPLIGRRTVYYPFARPPYSQLLPRGAAHHLLVSLRHTTPKSAMLLRKILLLGLGWLAPAARALDISLEDPGANLSLVYHGFLL